MRGATGPDPSHPSALLGPRCLDPVLQASRLLGSPIPPISGILAPGNVTHIPPIPGPWVPRTAQHTVDPRPWFRGWGCPPAPPASSHRVIGVSVYPLRVAQEPGGD